MAETTPSGGFDDRAIQRLAGLDKQIATLFTCKPLPESEISKLCDQVSTSLPFKQIRGSLIDKACFILSHAF